MSYYVLTDVYRKKAIGPVLSSSTSLIELSVVKKSFPMKFSCVYCIPQSTDEFDSRLTSLYILSFSEQRWSGAAWLLKPAAFKLPSWFQCENHKIRTMRRGANMLFEDSKFLSNYKVSYVSLLFQGCFTKTSNLFVQYFDLCFFHSILFWPGILWNLLRKPSDWMFVDKIVIIIRTIYLGC